MAITYEEMIKKAYAYYEENPDDFNRDIEELDSWNGYLNGERYYEMDFLDEYHYGVSLSEFLGRLDNEFRLGDDYFYYDGLGNLCSADEIDYVSDYLYDSTIEDIYENRSHLDLTDEIEEIFDEYDNGKEDEDDDEN